MTPSPAPDVLWSEIDDRVIALEALLTYRPSPLQLVTDRRPGAYALLYTGGLSMYRRLRRPGGRRDRTPIAVGGGAPIYIGSAVSLAERAGRHHRKLLRCSDVRSADVLMVALPTATPAGALYAEAGLIDEFHPVWNTAWLAGFGSKSRGAVRAAGAASPWAQLHPLRGDTATLTPGDLDRFRDTVREYLTGTVPPALTIRITPPRPACPDSRDSNGSSLRLVTS